jgi:hypothetical protein
MCRSLLRNGALLAMVVFSLTCPVAQGQDPFAVPKAKGVPRKPIPKSVTPPTASVWGEAKIEKKLKSPTQIEFVETPLKDVVDYLKDLHRMEIQLDEKGLKAAGIGSETQVTMNIKGLPLASALNLLLGQLGARWTIRDDVLVVTSPANAEAAEFFITKVYDVADLVACRDSAGQARDDYDTLTDVIVHTVAPVGKIHGATLGTAKVLVVTASYPTQQKIVKLLEETRAIAAKKNGNART